MFESRDKSVMNNSSEITQDVTLLLWDNKCVES